MVIIYPANSTPPLPPACLIPGESHLSQHSSSPGVYLQQNTEPTDGAVRAAWNEKAGFCCGPNGNRYAAINPLPALPDEFNTFLNSPDISRLSQKLNLIFSFAAMESTHTFPAPGNPSFVAVAGRIYHCVRTCPQDDTAIRWMLYNGFEDSSIPHHTQARDVPSSWVRALRTSLTQCNPFVSTVLSL